MARAEKKENAKRVLKDANRTIKECKKTLLHQERSLKIINIITESAETRYEGDRRIHDGDYKGAITCFDRVLDCYKTLARLLPKDKVAIRGMTEAWRSKGIALQKLGKRREASRCYKEALRIYPALYKDEIIAIIDKALGK